MLRPCCGHWGRHWGRYGNPIRVAIGVAIVWAFFPPFLGSTQACCCLFGPEGLLLLPDLLQSDVLERMAIR